VSRADWKRTMRATLEEQYRVHQKPLPDHVLRYPQILDLDSAVDQTGSGKAALTTRRSRQHAKWNLKLTNFSDHDDDDDDDKAAAVTVVTVDIRCFGGSEE
jgi:hypothetical protein